MAFIGEAVASAIIEHLISACMSYLKAGDMQGELEKLRLALPQVQTVLTAVEDEASIAEKNEALDTWLWQLRDAVESAEDALDELEYYELEKAIRGRDDKVRPLLSKCKTKVYSLFKRDDTPLKRLRAAVEGLDRVVAGMGPLLQLVTGLYGPDAKSRKLKKITNARETSSLLIESKVLGRDKERELIIEWLIKPGDADVSTFTIVGLGGLGKTTLAQLIYRDERVPEHFDPIMWVCVSQDFDAAVITRKMLEATGSGSLGDKSLNALHEILHQKLMSKRFLLVLDDVWNDDKRTEWEKLVAPFKFGQRGSKILLTTRMSSVADMAARVMQCKRKSLDLNELEKSDCMLLFRKHAFLGANPDDYKNLQPIGEQIAKKLGGCPLVIKVMGALLNSRMDYDYWKRILKEDIMKLQEGNDDIMAVLRLSYDHLPTNLQLCFRYCSIFPQDYEFKKNELVSMWMGSGLIPQSIYGRQSREEVGKEYLDILTRKSFFDCRPKDHLDNFSTCYIMHDMLHDLARSVSLGECSRIEVDVAVNIIPKTIRHLSIEIVNFLSVKEISNLKNLRTLVISVKKDREPDTDHILVLNEVIKGSKNLRLLALSAGRNFYKLPDALGSLIHLRYLSFERWIDGESLTDFFPQSLYRLYHLEVIKLPTSYAIGTSDDPEYDGLTNLANLSSIDVPSYMIENIPYISKLPFIRKLENFSVREKSGFKIGELGNLRYLRHLSIRKLENVRTSQEALRAKLNEKEYLKSLSFSWSPDHSSCAEIDEELLDNLCPHINLKKLRIKEYNGVKSPCWMTDPSLVNLTSIELIDCKRWEQLPPLGLLPLLNCLELDGLHAVKQIGCSFFGSGGVCAFPSLKQLFILCMPNLELIEIDDGCMFPQLHTMQIFGCPNLRELLALPRSLRQLITYDVGSTALHAINQDCGDNNQQQQAHFRALESLSIKRCEKLESLPAELFGKSKPLKFLCVTNCPKLKKFESSDIQLPSTLNGVNIGSCGDLEVSLFQSLWNATDPTTLYLADCASIASLPLSQVFARWTMLSTLTIENCKQLSSFGGIQALSTLKYLRIEGCDKLIAVSQQQPPLATGFSKENAVDSFLKYGRLWIDHHALLLIEPLRSLTFVESFILSNASQLTSLPEEWLLQNHASLKELKFGNARSLPSLPHSMTELCSLEDLEVRGAFLIQSLPELPASLRVLEMTYCHPVLRERCQENIGLDWPKIANIPRVAIR